MIGAIETYDQVTVELLERELTLVKRDRGQLRDELRREQERRLEAEQLLERWRALACRYGSEITIGQWREAALRGSVTIAAELAMQGPHAIALICQDLAQKLIAAVPR